MIVHIILTVPPLAVVATWEMVTEFAATDDIKGITVAAAARAFVGEKVQIEEVVAPVTVIASEVAVV